MRLHALSLQACAFLCLSLGRLRGRATNSAAATPIAPRSGPPVPIAPRSAPARPPQVPGHALGACKEAINKAAADALLAYRTHCASASSSGQLILPEALKLLPLYTLALSKSTVFRTDARPDARAAAMWQLLSLPAHKVVALIYPRMVALHTLLDRPAVRRRGRGRAGHAGGHAKMPCRVLQKALPIMERLQQSARRLHLGSNHLCAP